ncbi:MAG: type IV secretion system protein [Minisyncoccales bacterium]
MKKNYFYLLILIFVFSLIPLLASAGGVADLAQSIALKIFCWAFVLFLTLTSALVWLVGAILDWVIGPNFVTLSYTQPCPGGMIKETESGLLCNPIIGVGLGITQSLVNLLLVVFLVVIALAMALQYQEYGSRKTLIKLIVVALLVNFAPVFVGLIVDAANIIIYYFLSQVKDIAGFGSMFKTMFADLGQSFKQDYFDPSANLNLLMRIITAIVINVVLFIVFLLYAIIFIVRYIMIWCLTILSPLAVVCWVLPATKRFFNQWWNQVIQWSFIGLPLAFFLYLGISIFAQLSSVFKSRLTLPGGEAATANFLNQILPYSVVAIFLLLGVILGLQTSAMGATAVMNFAKKSGRQATAFLGKGTLAGAKRLEQRIPSKYKEPLLKTAEKMATARGGWGAVATVTGARWAARRGLTLIEARQAEIEKGRESAAKFKTPAALTAELRKEMGVGGNLDRALGLMAGGYTNPKMRAAINENLTDAEKIKLAQRANELGDQKTAQLIGRNNLHLVEQMNFEFKPEDKTKYPGGIKEKIIAETKPADVGQLSKDFYKDPAVMNSVMKHWTGQQLGAAAVEHSREFVNEYTKKREEIIQDAIKKGKDPIQAVVNLNPHAALYTTGSAAQDLGFVPPLGLSRGEIRKRMEKGLKTEKARVKEFEEVRKAEETKKATPQPPPPFRSPGRSEK